MSKPTSKNRGKPAHQRGAKCKPHCKPQKDNRFKDSAALKKGQALRQDSKTDYETEQRP